MKKFYEILNSYNKDIIIKQAEQQGKIINISEENLVKMVDFKKLYIEELGDLIEKPTGECYVFRKDVINKVFAFSSDNKSSWTRLNTKVKLHNKIFPETRYTITAVLKMPENSYNNINTDNLFYLGGSDLDVLFSGDGYLPVLSQKIVDNVGKVTYKELQEKMIQKGFEEVDHCIFEKDGIYVHDVKSANAGKSNLGEILIFDPEISFSF